MATKEEVEYKSWDTVPKDVKDAILSETRYYDDLCNRGWSAIDEVIKVGDASYKMHICCQYSYLNEKDCWECDAEFDPEDVDEECSLVITKAN